MKSTKWLIVLACALPVIGFLVTATDIAETNRGFSLFLQNRNLTPEDIKAATSEVNHQFASAWRYTAAGLIGGFILAALVLIVRLLRRRQSPPPLPMQTGTTIIFVIVAIVAILIVLCVISIPVNMVQRYHRVEQETAQVRAAVQEAVRKQELIVNQPPQKEFAQSPVESIADLATQPVFQMRLVLDAPSGETELMTRFIMRNGEISKQTFNVQKTVLLDQTTLKSATVITDKTADTHSIEIVFTDAGAKRFAEVTRQNIGKQFAIIIAGQVVEAPMIQDEISGGKANITGTFSEQEAKDLAAKITESLKR